MSDDDCGCEGSCPVCLVGEVEHHRCDTCRARFCPDCHGIAVAPACIPLEDAELRVAPCGCAARRLEGR